MAHKPFTLRGATSGKAKAIDLRLEATSWEVAAGHRLVLVVDTVDPRYRGLSALGATVTFSSPAGDPSWAASAQPQVRAINDEIIRSADGSGTSGPTPPPGTPGADGIHFYWSRPAARAA